MKKLLTGLIRLYQRHISSRRAACCKYEPTCSQYAVEAIEVHGAFKGLGLAIWRILRCNPFSKGGFDPVPEKKQKASRKQHIIQPGHSLRRNGG